MRKILTIAWSEFTTALLSKAFLIGVLFVPALMLLSVVVQRTMGQRADREDRTFAVIDHTDRLYPVLALAAEAWNARQTPGDGRPQTGPRYLPSRVTPGTRPIDEVRLELSERVAKKELFAFVEIPADALEEADAGRTDPGRTGPMRYHSTHPGYRALPAWLETVLNQAIAAERLRAAGVDVSLLRALNQKTPLDNLGLMRREPDGAIREAEKVDRIKTLAIPVALMTLMFIVIMSSASPLLNSVMEEKMTRISEVMLGSVTPFELMLGKLVGSLLISLLLTVVYTLGGFAMASYWGYGNALAPSIAGWFLLYLTLAILIFGAAFMAIGAATTDLKDAQGMMTPVMMAFILPFLVWEPVLRAPESLFATVVSLVPFATPMLMLVRLTLQPGPPIWQILLSVILTGATALLFVWAAGKIFRTGILMQGKSASLTEMIRWIRT